MTVLGEGLWQRAFGADPAILGRTVQLDGAPYTVVGVLDQSFRGISDEAELWVPMAAMPADDLAERGRRGYQVLGRLRGAATLAQAQAELGGVAERLQRAYPDTNRDRGVELVPLHRELFGDLSLPLLVLFGAELFVPGDRLCGRGAPAAGAREHPAAGGGGAPGAGRGPWPAAAAVPGGEPGDDPGGRRAGLLAGRLGRGGAGAAQPRGPAELRPPPAGRGDPGVHLCISMACGVAFGLLPALGARKLDVEAGLREGGRAGSPDASRRRLRSGLIVAEVALALMLLVGAGLLLRTLLNLQRFDPGFRAAGLFTARTSLPEERYPEAEAGVFAQRLLDRLAALPGVSAAALATDVPLGGSSSATFVSLEGRDTASAAGRIRVYTHRVSPGFFAAAGTPLLQGRDFTASENPADVVGSVVVSASFARRFWPKSNPLGSILLAGRDRFSVVGVAGDVRYRKLLKDESWTPTSTSPCARCPHATSRCFCARPSDPPL